MISAGSDINGLVLAGGMSRRMGRDKGKLNWHGKEQRYYMYDLLQLFCNKVFISCRDEQVNEIESNYHTLVDTFTGMGPYGAILSALHNNRNTAWLVTACDLPLLDAATLQYLVENRRSDKVATTFESPHDGMPEPLITIWEPKSYDVLLHFRDKGYTCPRKVLMNNDVAILKPPHPEMLMNANTPEDAVNAKNVINKLYNHAGG